MTSDPHISITPSAGDAVSVDALLRAHVEATVAKSATLKDAACVLGVDRITVYRWLRAWGSTVRPNRKS